MEKEALLSSEGGIEEEGGNVASNENDDNVQVLSIKHLETDDLGTFTETEDELGGARVEIAMSKSVRISDDPPDLIGGGGERRTREEDDIVYTVEDAIDKMGFGPFQILVTVFAGMVWVSDYYFFLLSLACMHTRAVHVLHVNQSRFTVYSLW